MEDRYLSYGCIVLQALVANLDQRSHTSAVRVCGRVLFNVGSHLLSESILSMAYNALSWGSERITP